MFLEPPLHGFHAEQTSTITAASLSVLQPWLGSIGTHPHSQTAPATPMHDGRNIRESRSGARPQHWGDLVVFSGIRETCRKADEISADPWLLPPSEPVLRRAGQRQHVLSPGAQNHEV